MSATNVAPPVQAGTDTAKLEKISVVYGSKDDRVRTLISHLDDLQRTSDTVSASRAALAELRQAIKDPLRGAKHVVPCLGEADRNDEAWFYRIASLFAMHRKHANGVSLGAAFRRVREDRGSDSIEGRFLALLSSNSEQLFDRLVGAVTLLKADEQPLDWCRLLDDVLRWDAPGKPAQHRIARDYYRAASEDDGASTISAAASAA